MIERRTGVAMWRQIADAIRLGIAEGEFGGGPLLPPESKLAERFGVNRHTVRSAISALMREGLVRPEQGRGTVILRRKRLNVPISRRTRFSASLAGQAAEGTVEVLSSGITTVPADVQPALGLAPETPCLRIDLVYRADGLPVSRSTNWFDAQRFPRMIADVERTGSITKALAAQGVHDYVRQSTVITAGHADETDYEDLQLAAGAVVMTALAVDADLDGRPVQVVRTRFAADRVSILVTTDPQS